MESESTKSRRKEVENEIDKDKAEEGGYRYEYDQEGNVVKGISLYSTEHTEKNFSYDKEGYMTKCEGLHSLDDYDNTPFTFRYNEQHKPITISNGYCKWEYEYGKDLVSKITYDDGVYDIKYDENKKKVCGCSPILPKLERKTKKKVFILWFILGRKF